MAVMSFWRASRKVRRACVHSGVVPQVSRDHRVPVQKQAVRAQRLSVPLARVPSPTHPVRDERAADADGRPPPLWRPTLSIPWAGEWKPPQSVGQGACCPSRVAELG
ncbi:hypothetical protein GCM10010231_53770 [Streptomyces sindenensis]|nr:hypothetical protein GCM10010231_53770 [Streptomyces sindenensis]